MVIFLSTILFDAYDISIHKALTGLDFSSSFLPSDNSHFNPQGPHGPRLYETLFRFRLRNFNPQGPHGPRRWRTWRSYRSRSFQSTRPSRASTTRATANRFRRIISIHKALTGLDFSFHVIKAVLVVFQSTRPSRASTGSHAQYMFSVGISIHKALTGLDQ